MVTIQATDQGAIDKAALLLSGLDGGLKKALRSAGQRAASNLRTNATKAVRERYAISAKNVKANENVKVTYDYSNGVRASILFSGSKIGLFKYDGVSPGMPKYEASRTERIRTATGWIKGHPGVAAKAHQLKGTSPTTFHDAFVARFKSGYTGIFERTGGTTASGADEVRELMGLSVPQMLGSEEVQEKLGKDAMDKFEERLEHETMALLAGWR